MADPVQDLLDSSPLQSVPNINGETLTYRTFHDQNEALSLVVIYGYGGRGDYLAAELAVHLKDHRLIGVNPRGYGESTLNEETFDFKQDAEDIKILLDRIGVKKTMVVGFSAGGCIAAYLTLLYPETITACFLYSGPPLDGPRWVTLRSDGSIPEEPHLASCPQDMEQHALGIQALGANSEDETECRTFWETFFGGGNFMPAVGTPAMKRFHEACLQYRNRVGRAIACWAFNVTPIKTPAAEPSDLLSKLRCPMVVLHGKKDIVASYAQAKAVTELAIAEEWAPKGLLSFYEFDLPHFALLADAPQFMQVYRKALKEQVLEREE